MRRSKDTRGAVFLLSLGLSLLASCAGGGVRAAEPLPFHVAVLPVSVAELEQGSARDGKATELSLAFDAQRLSLALTRALDSRGFTRATLLRAPPTEGATEAPHATWLREAGELHADLVLDSRLDFHPGIRTELNDRFWLNLPLFLLGGPAGWFVNDRSYYFDARFDVQLFDVTAASRTDPLSLDTDSRVFHVQREAKEASLDFLDRASGTGSYALSFLLPAGLVARSSKSVPGELEAHIVEVLCDGLVAAIHERAFEIEESELVDFHPELAVVGHVPERFLQGELVLRLGDVNQLVGTRVRFDDGDFTPHALGEARLDPSGRSPVRRYPVSIPIGAREAGAVQLEVRQEDRDSTARTFTYAIVPSTGQE